MWRAASVISAVFISGCIYLPQTSTTYNAECEIDERHMTLEGRQVAEIAGCSNEGCVGLLVAAGSDCGGFRQCGSCRECRVLAGEEGPVHDPENEMSAGLITRRS